MSEDTHSRGNGRSETRVIEETGAWCAAWRFVTAMSAGRVLDSLGPARAAEVVQAWGLIVVGAEVVR